MVSMDYELDESHSLLKLCLSIQEFQNSLSLS